MGHSNCGKCGHDTKMCSCKPETNEKVNSKQVGGSHYISEYQHWDWAIDMKIGPIEYAATKYISRWWKKHGPEKGVEDLEKAKHYIQKIIEAHSQNRYLCAYSRERNSYHALLKTIKFSYSNDLKQIEHDLCWKLVSWEHRRDLEDCIELINTIIADPKKALASRGSMALG